MLDENLCHHIRNLSIHRIRNRIPYQGDFYNPNGRNNFQFIGRQTERNYSHTINEYFERPDFFYLKAHLYMGDKL